MRIARAAAFLAIVLAVAPPAAAQASGLPEREADPVVLTGSQAPSLLGASPGSIVAFAFEGGWRQVPVQVDERAVVDLAAVRAGSQTANRPFSTLAYTDPGTLAGPDPDPALDGDDEIAAMAKDAGQDAGDKRAPEGVAPGTRTDVTITDPLAPAAARHLYLFRSDAGLDPSAGSSYVDYRFRLDSGDYKTTYDFGGSGDDGSGPPANPESSTVSTPFYSQRLPSRWIEDQLRVTAPGASGVDILDGDKAQVSFGCGRSELTFSRGGGGFIVNRSGPVRAIRSYIGANSGTYTQRDQIYYERADVSRTYLRVHPGITTITQFLDYAPAASGMTYRNSAFPAGVTIDGMPDPGIETGNSLGPPISWEQVTGAQGTLAIVNRVATDLPGFTPGSYYEDDLTPAAGQCGGYADTQTWGASGPGFSGSGANTDPTLGAAYSLTNTRTIFYGGPGGSAAGAELRSRQVDAPLSVTVSSDPAEPALRLRGRAPKRVVAGSRIRLRVKLVNEGSATARGVRVCAEAKRRLLATGRCATVGRLKPGASRRVRVELELRRAAAGRGRVKVRLRARLDGVSVAKDRLALRPRKRPAA